MIVHNKRWEESINLLRTLIDPKVDILGGIAESKDGSIQPAQREADKWSPTKATSKSFSYPKTAEPWVNAITCKSLKYGTNIGWQGNMPSFIATEYLAFTKGI